MAGAQIPGPLGSNAATVESGALRLDEGTLCLWRTPPPVPVCSTRSAWSPVPRPTPAPVAPQARRMSVPGGHGASALALSQDGIDLLKAVERLWLQTYDDQTGKAITAWVPGATIGYGHLVPKAQWETYRPGIDAAAAEALLRDDVAPFEAAVAGSVTAALQQYEYDALVILAFNIGVDGFAKSSVVKLVNDPKAVTGYASLEAAWMAWNKSQGKVMKGLDNRRRCEWKIWTTATYAPW